MGTAGVHLYLFLIEGFPGNGKMPPVYQLLFVGNFLACATLAAAPVSPISPLARVRPFVRALLITIAVAAIASYFYVGVIDVIGNIDKAIEALLIVLVTADAAASGSEEDPAGQYASGPFGAADQLVVGAAAGAVMFLALTPFMVWGTTNGLSPTEQRASARPSYRPPWGGNP